jgi:hypothetical protein
MADKVHGLDVVDLIAQHLAANGLAIKRFEALGGQLRLEQRVKLGLEGKHRNVGGVALVT